MGTSHFQGRGILISSHPSVLRSLSQFKFEFACLQVAVQERQLVIDAQIDPMGNCLTISGRDKGEKLNSPSLMPGVFLPPSRSTPCIFRVEIVNVFVTEREKLPSLNWEQAVSIPFKINLQPFIYMFISVNQESHRAVTEAFLHRQGAGH